MKPFSPRVMLVVALCLAGLLAAFYAVSGLRARTTPLSSSAGSASEPVPASPGLLAVQDVGAREIVDRVAVVLAKQLTQSGLRNKNELATDAQTILLAWLNGTADDYLHYLSESATDPPPAPVWADAERRDNLWLEGTAHLRAASFDPAALTVRAAYREGRPVATDDRVSRAWGSRFDKLSPFDRADASTAAIEAARLDVYEVRIPMRVRGLVSGKEFDALLGMSYGWDKDVSKWILVEVSVYGVPTGDAIRTPAF